jgi:hypothetical protein
LWGSPMYRPWAGLSCQKHNVTHDQNNTKPTEG